MNKQGGGSFQDWWCFRSAKPYEDVLRQKEGQLFQTCHRLIGPNLDKRVRLLSLPRSAWCCSCASNSFIRLIGENHFSIPLYRRDNYDFLSGSTCFHAYHRSWEWLWEQPHRPCHEPKPHIQQIVPSQLLQSITKDHFLSWWLANEGLLVGMYGWTCLKAWFLMYQMCIK